MPRATSDDLEAAVQTLPGGWTGTFLRTTPSTQDVARVAAAAGASSRSIFVADYQTAGRGRHGRRWLASPGTALMLSIVLRSRVTPRAWSATTLASVALAEAVERLAPALHVEIKWPNDLMLNACKFAGILAEATSNGVEQTTIVGVGVNVSSSAADLAPIQPAATSLLKEAGRRVGRAHLLRAFVAELDHWQGQSDEALHAAWSARLWRRGQTVRLANHAGELADVVVLGVEADGALHVRLPDGSTQRTLTGELLP